jgi:hypothetical protein
MVAETGRNRRNGLRDKTSEAIQGGLFAGKI